jgi:hypothetical protein
MTRGLSRIFYAMGLLLGAALLVPVSPVRAIGKPLLVVMSTSVRVSDISTSTLRRVFQGLPTEFQGGKRFIPVNHPTGTPARIQFDRAVLGLEPSQVGAFWIDRRIRDESPPPRTVPSADLALRVAASLPGAIAYIAPELLTAAVKVLTIDGRSAGQPEYLLR